MPSISHMTATGSCGNLHNTSTMLFVRPRPWRRCLLRICLQFPRYSRKQLLSFPAFLGDTLHGAECTTRVNYLFKFFGWNFLRVTSADNITHKGQVICLIFASDLSLPFSFLRRFRTTSLLLCNIIDSCLNCSGISYWPSRLWWIRSLTFDRTFCLHDRENVPQALSP